MKPLLKKLVYRGGGLKISGCRGMSVGTKPIVFAGSFGAMLVWRGRMVLLMKKYRDLKVRGENQYFPGGIGWVFLQ